MTSAWKVVSRWPLVDADAEKWWQLLGPHLATLTEAAGYTFEEQVNVLLFLLSQAIPSVGSAPSTNSFAHWKSLLTNDGSPFEYSWKWNQKSGKPEIRYCIEAIGATAGKPDDPMNLKATDTLFENLARLLPGLNTVWLRHYIDSFDLARKKKNSQKQDDPISSMFVAFEHGKHDVVVKAYFLPSEDVDGGRPTFSTFDRAIRPISQDHRALDAVLEYVSTDKYGSTLAPDMLAIDCVEPSQSRLKLYAGSPKTSLESIISVMTLGGKIKNVEKGIEQLTELFHLVLSTDGTSLPLSEETPVQNAFDAALAHPFDLYENMVYYFDIAPKSSLPDVKFYIPAIRLGASDQAVTEGLGRFLQRHGRDTYFEGFERSLREIKAAHASNSEHRVQTFIAVAFQKEGELALTSYMNPGFYHAKLKQTNGVGDA